MTAVKMQLPSSRAGGVPGENGGNRRSGRLIMLNNAISLCRFTGPSSLNNSSLVRLKRSSEKSVRYAGHPAPTSSLAAAPKRRRCNSPYNALATTSTGFYPDYTNFIELIKIGTEDQQKHQPFEQRVLFVAHLNKYAQIKLYVTEFTFQVVVTVIQVNIGSNRRASDGLKRVWQHLMQVFCGMCLSVARRDCRGRGETSF